MRRRCFEISPLSFECFISRYHLCREKRVMREDEERALTEHSWMRRPMMWVAFSTICRIDQTQEIIQIADEVDRKKSRWPKKVFANQNVLPIMPNIFRIFLYFVESFTKSSTMMAKARRRWSCHERRRNENDHENFRPMDRVRVELKEHHITEEEQEDEIFDLERQWKSSDREKYESNQTINEFRVYTLRELKKPSRRYM